MPTFDEMGLSGGTDIGVCDPMDLDIGQWVSVAREAGMRYAILTAKH